MTPVTQLVGQRGRGRCRDVPRPGWRAAVLAAAAVPVLPVAVIAAETLTPSPAVWAQLWDTRLPAMLATTAALLVVVGLGTLALGAGLAWLVTAHDFPGRQTLSWLLVLPIAMPAYILGFVFLALLDHAGPAQTALRTVFGPDVWFPEIRSVLGAGVVLTLTLYPYVYLLARSAIGEHAAATVDVARTLGLSRWRTATRVVLPLARPSLAAGGALVAMETLTDFATVQYFNVETVSVGIYRIWNGMLDRGAASELAGLVLVIALALLAGERLLRGRARYHQSTGGRGVAPARLTGWRGWLATGVCVGVLAAAVGIPTLQLLAWSGLPAWGGQAGLAQGRFVINLANSGLLAAVTAGLCVALALVVAHGTRMAGGSVTRRAARLSMVGYAVPGVILAVGVLVLFTGLDAPMEAVGLPGARPLVTGTLMGVVVAYVARFVAVAYGALDAGTERLSPSMTMSALALRASGTRVLTRVHLPLLRGGLGVAAVLVAIDAIKELPMVLLLRPFGFESLSVRVWTLAGESLWAQAALPALVIVAVSAVPVVVLFRRSTTGPGMPALAAADDSPPPHQAVGR